MDRYWFFTWRTYGTWLPGSPGFVGYYHTPPGQRIKDNAPGTATTDPIPALERYARTLLRAEPVYLTRRHADALLSQLHAHAAFRGWEVDAIAILADHVHIVFGVPGDPEPDRLLVDWKAYASRPLNRLIGWPPANPERDPANPERKRGGKRSRPVWWEEGGSTRRLKAAENRVGAIKYVRDQENPLVVWLSETATRLVAE